MSMSSMKVLSWALNFDTVQYIRFHSLGEKKYQTLENQYAASLEFARITAPIALAFNK